ncbi:MAG: hypothetical protein ACT4PL_14180, partial [Phycisphaerales bacterium]
QDRSSSGNIAIGIIAPPAFIEDLGNLSLPVADTRSCDVNAGGVSWFRFSLGTDADAGLGTFLDFDTENSGGDTELGVYRLDGTLVVSDDDDGSGLLTQISFGAGGRPAVGTSVAYNGRDGTLPAGTYYLAVAQFNANFAADFTVTGTGTGLFGVNVNFRSRVDPIAPTGTGTATPATLGNDGAFDTVLRVAVTPGSFPASTNLMVEVDAGPIGAGTVTLHDDGVAPDTIAGDNIYFGSATVASGTAEGPTPLNFFITDGEMRSGAGTINTTIFTPQGGCCTTEGCAIKSRALCDGQGGTYLGDNIPCTSGDGYAQSASSAVFEDVTGNPNAVRQGLTDDSTVLVDIGFDFALFGQSYSQVNVCSNGFLQFGGASTVFTNTAIPTAAAPNNCLYVAWDDFNPGAAGAAAPNGIYTVAEGESPNRRFIASWHGIPQFGQTDINFFQVILHEDGRAEFVYGSMTDQAAADITCGVENLDGTAASTFPDPSDNGGNNASTVSFVPGDSNCPTVNPCDIDFNNDGIVEPGDLDDFITFFFSDLEEERAQCDFNNDGLVEPGDLDDFITAFFGGC